MDGSAAFGGDRFARAAAVVTGPMASWLGVVFWLAVVAAALPFATRIGSVETSRLTQFLPSGAASTKALQLDGAFPSGRNQQAEVVFYRAGGLTPADLRAVRADAARLASALGTAIGAPSATIRAPDDKVALLVVPVLGDEAQVQRTILRTRAVLGSGTGGLEVRVTGQAAIQADLLAAFNGADLMLLVATAVIVALLLAATYRSPVLWLVPLMCVGIAEAVAEAVIFGLGHLGLTVNGQSTTLATVIVFGAGTDYAMLLTARYREELLRHSEHRVAMAVAFRRAAPAVIASSATVAAGLACLLLAKLNLTSGFGVVGVVGVLAAAVVVLAAYPALLLVMGRRVFWPAVPRHTPDFVQRGPWAWVGRVVSRGSRPVWIAGFVLLGAAAVGLFSVNTNVSSLSELPTSAGSVQGYQLVAGHFPAGEVEPVDVVVTDARALVPVQHALRALPVTESVGAPERAADMARFSLILAVNPSGKAGFRAIGELRAAAARASSAPVYIGGQTAQDVDTAQTSHRDIFVVVPTVLAVVLIVLWLLLRALLGPVVLVLTVIVTFGAALGVMSWIFVPAFGLPGTDPTVPLLTFVFLVALGVDYNIFLLTRVREEVRTRGWRDGVREGVASTGGVLTSAGLVLAATFAVLGILPIVASREIGIVVALGVLADTFLVRTVLVPTLAADLGGRFWWPTRTRPPL